jgi:hypothetical protein
MRVNAVCNWAELCERIRFRFREENERASDTSRAFAPGGGKGRIEEQHAKGKLTARERLDLLLDPGSFVETDRFALSQSRNLGSEEKRILGDRVVTGHGTIDGRPVYIFAHDFRWPRGLQACARSYPAHQPATHKFPAAHGQSGIRIRRTTSQMATRVWTRIGPNHPIQPKHD